MTDWESNPLKLREIILNTRKPLVFKNFPLNWSCFKNGLKEWCKAFDESDGFANFERMSKNDCFEPQWERKREVIQSKVLKFLEEHSKNVDYWFGLNYKRRSELPVNCTNGIDFTPFGFPEASDDSTLWLSSGGANTPCHYDSYGCNIVVQVFGKKSWLLFAPNAPLSAIRIPYEESSIYCKENFYSPTEDMNRQLGKYKDLVHHVILEPNDVLIVPKHWWHYVEAVDVSLSVNSWIPLKCDLEQQIEECIVKYLIENFVKNSPLETKVYIINPNQLTNFAKNDEMFEILKYLLNESKKEDPKAKISTILYDYQYLSENDTVQLINDFQSVRQISYMTGNELELILKSRCRAHGENVIEKTSLNALEEILINSICSPYCIKVIKNEFFKSYKEL